MRVIALACLVGSLLMVVSCGSDDDDGSPMVSGLVTVAADGPDVAELPDGATLTIAIQDTSIADAPATDVATETADLAGLEFPIEFALDYDPDAIDDSLTYSMLARVEAGGDLLMINDTFTPVITNGAPTSDVEVALVLIAAN
jgi:putative lipoprotein